MFAQLRDKILIGAVSAMLLFSIVLLYEVSSFSPPAGGTPSGNMLFAGNTDSFPASVEISDPKQDVASIGFGPDYSSLNFGIVPTGGNYARKFLEMSNGGDSEILIMLNAEGDIKSMIVFEKNNFVLGPGEYSKVPIVLKTTNSTAVGNYTGTIFISKVKAKNYLGTLFLNDL